jgi:hypothetical protein
VADTKTTIEQAYSAFNKRDIASALALMRRELAQGFGGRQDCRKRRNPRLLDSTMGEFDPHVEPLAITEEDGGRVRVRVHQLVKSLEGDVLSDSEGPSAAFAHR